MAQRTRTTVALAGVVLTLTLAACGDDPAPVPPSTTPAPSTSTTTSTASTSTPAPTTVASDPVLAKIPPAARPNTQAGAEAFGRFFIGEISAAYVKADTSGFAGLFSATCKACTGYRDGAAKLASEGRHLASPRLIVESSSANSFGGNQAIVAVGVVEAAVDVLAKDGVRVDVTDGGDTATLVLTLTWKNHWTVQRLQVEKL